MYLMKYGYMDGHTKSNKSAPLLSRDGLRDYVEEFQSFAGLAVTGELDQGRRSGRRQEVRARLPVGGGEWGGGQGFVLHGAGGLQQPLGPEDQA